MLTELPQLFVQIVNAHMLFLAKERGEQVRGTTRQALAWSVDFSLRRLRTLHEQGERFDFQEYLDQSGMNALNIEDLQSLFEALLGCRAFLESMALFRGLPALQERFRQMGLVEWLDASAERYTVNIAVAHFLAIMEQRIQAGTLFGREWLRQALLLAEFFDIFPLPGLDDVFKAFRAVGFLPMTEEMLWRTVM